MDHDIEDVKPGPVRMKSENRDDDGGKKQNVQDRQDEPSAP